MNADAIQEAIEGMGTLGYKKKDAAPLIEEAARLRPSEDTEGLIKTAFRIAKGKPVEPEAPDAHEPVQEAPTPIRPELEPATPMQWRLPGYMILLHNALAGTVMAAAVLDALIAGVFLWPMLAWGPFRPWVLGISWLLGHGEVGVPVALAVVAAVLIPQVRERVLSVFATAAIILAVLAGGAALIALLIMDVMAFSR